MRRTLEGSEGGPWEGLSGYCDVHVAGSIPVIWPICFGDTSMYAGRREVLYRRQQGAGPLAECVKTILKISLSHAGRVPCAASQKDERVRFGSSVAKIRRVLPSFAGSLVLGGVDFGDIAAWELHHRRPAASDAVGLNQDACSRGFCFRQGIGKIVDVVPRCVRTDMADDRQ